MYETLRKSAFATPTINLLCSSRNRNFLRFPSRGKTETKPSVRRTRKGGNHPPVSAVVPLRIRSRLILSSDAREETADNRGINRFGLEVRRFGVYRLVTDEVGKTFCRNCVFCDCRPSVLEPRQRLVCYETRDRVRPRRPARSQLRLSRIERRTRVEGRIGRFSGPSRIRHDDDHEDGVDVGHVTEKIRCAGNHRASTEKRWKCERWSIVPWCLRG